MRFFVYFGLCLLLNSFWLLIKYLFVICIAHIFANIKLQRIFLFAERFEFHSKFKQRKMFLLQKNNSFSQGKKFVFHLCVYFRVSLGLCASNESAQKARLGDYFTRKIWLFFYSFYTFLFFIYVKRFQFRFSKNFFHFQSK